MLTLRSTFALALLSITLAFAAPAAHAGPPLTPPSNITLSGGLCNEWWIKDRAYWDEFVWPTVAAISRDQPADVAAAQSPFISSVFSYVDWFGGVGGKAEFAALHVELFGNLTAPVDVQASRATEAFLGGWCRSSGNMVVVHFQYYVEFVFEPVNGVRPPPVTLPLRATEMLRLEDGVLRWVHGHWTFW